MYFAWDWKGWCICPTVKLRSAEFQAMSRKEDGDVCVTQLYRSPGPLPTRPWGVLTELVSYMYPIYVHYMYILDVLSFPFGSRHWPYWDCEVRSKSKWRVSCIAPTVLWLFYNTDHNRQIYRGHIPWQFVSACSTWGTPGRGGENTVDVLPSKLGEVPTCCDVSSFWKRCT